MLERVSRIPHHYGSAATLVAVKMSGTIPGKSRECAIGMLLAKSRVAMPINRSIVLAACLLLATAARAEDAPQPPLAVGDVVYKGLVGKALDAVPMDPDERLTLQRTSAVVSNTLTGRSLSVWAGLTNPILWIAGLAWGLFSASNIKPAQANAKPDANRVAPLDPIEAAQTQVAVLMEP